MNTTTRRTTILNIISFSPRHLLLDEETWSLLKMGQRPNDTEEQRVLPLISVHSRLLVTYSI